MSNVTPIHYSKKIKLALEIKRKNDDIIHELYLEGKVKYDPYHQRNKYPKNNVIEIPEACFKMKQAYKVGV